MLKQIELHGVRRFDRHVVNFRPTTVIVGANNAGKTTIVDALRLVAVVANRSTLLKYNPTPDWIDRADVGFGVSPSMRDIGADLSTLVSAFTGPPARIVAHFDSGAVVEVFVHTDQSVFGVLRTPTGVRVHSKSAASSLRLPRIGVQPTVAPLDKQEGRRRSDSTIRRALDTTMAPRHFRNQLRLLYDDHFDDFVDLASATWTALEVQSLEGGSLLSNGEYDDLRLNVRNGGYVGEVASMGHGLQMWLQIMWFLARNKETPVIVLDEPDVYMHPDLQRRLVRHLKGDNRQVIIATHSVEIMAEVEPSQMLVVDGDLDESRWAAEAGGLAHALGSVGGTIRNVDLARLMSSDRFLLVEGDDVHLLRRPFDLVRPSSDALDVVPRHSIGGWDGWQQARGACGVFRKSGGVSVQSFCIFDSDYKNPRDIVRRLNVAKQENISLHIWWRKEVESYFIAASAVHRLVSARATRGRTVPDEVEIEDQIAALASNLEDDLLNCLAETYRHVFKAASVSKCRGWAKRYIEFRVSTGTDLAFLVSAKRLLGRLSDWSASRCGASFGPADLAGEMQPDEVPQELAEVLGCIADGEPFPEDLQGRWRSVPDEFHLQSP